MTVTVEQNTSALFVDSHRCNLISGETSNDEQVANLAVNDQIYSELISHMATLCQSASG
jgi:hypothetical protein